MRAREAVSSARASAFSTAVATSSVKLPICVSVFAGKASSLVLDAAITPHRRPADHDRAADRRPNTHRTRLLRNRAGCPGEALDPDRANLLSHVAGDARSIEIEPGVDGHVGPRSTPGGHTSYRPVCLVALHSGEIGA